RGPPTERLVSQMRASALGARSPACRISSVKLLLCIDPLAQFEKAVPHRRLPPCRGTRFIAGPAFSASPRPPAVENTTSCALPTSATVYDTPVPFSDAPSERPSTVNRPSLPGPLRIANVTVSGPARPPTSWLP